MYCIFKIKEFYFANVKYLEFQYKILLERVLDKQFVKFVFIFLFFLTFSIYAMLLIWIA